jgi:hypothetical protein
MPLFVASNVCQSPAHHHDMCTALPSSSQNCPFNIFSASPLDWSSLVNCSPPPACLEAEVRIVRSNDSDNCIFSNTSQQACIGSHVTQTLHFSIRTQVFVLLDSLFFHQPIQSHLRMTLAVAQLVSRKASSITAQLSLTYWEMQIVPKVSGLTKKCSI